MEGKAACFAEEPAFVKRDDRAPVMGGNMANSLLGPWILDDAVDRSSAERDVAAEPEGGIKKTIKNPIIIHYKGHILHQLIDDESSYSDVYDYYRVRSPWKDISKCSVYYNPEIGAEIEKCTHWPSDQENTWKKSYMQVKIFESLHYIKWKLLGEPIWWR